MEESAGEALLVAGEDGHLFLVDLAEGRHLLSVLSNLKVEGSVADTAFRDGTVLCLHSGDGAQGGEKDDCGAGGLAGRQITHIRVADGGRMSIVRVIELKDLCSGIALDRTTCYFFSFLARKKAIAKFILQEHVSQSCDAH